MKKFKTESKRVLDMVINSIYTHKEIFLRELLSNASDAIDKLYYKGLTSGLSGLDRGDFSIDVKVDKDARTITVEDNGIGMTETELEENLGTIAKSGSLAFKEAHKDADVDVIGQFGVGFYSARRTARSRRISGRATARTVMRSSPRKRRSTGRSSRSMSNRIPRRRSTAVIWTNTLSRA